MFQVSLYVSDQFVCFRSVCMFHISLYVSGQFVCFRSVCMFQISLYVSGQFVCFRSVCMFQISLYVSDQFVCFRSVCMFQVSLYISGQFVDSPGLGFLRLHSTFRHDLKIYASDEGRVQMTAAAFTKVGDLPSLVKQALNIRQHHVFPRHFECFLCMYFINNFK